MPTTRTPSTPDTADRPTLAATRALRKAIRGVGAGVPLENALDARTSLGKRVRALRAALVEQLGGPEAITPTRAVLCEQLVRALTVLDAMDSVIFSTALDAKDPAVRKLVTDVSKQRHLVSQLCGQIGLLAAPKPVLSPRQILELEAQDEGA